MADYTNPTNKKVADPEVPANKPARKPVVNAKYRVRKENGFRALRKIFQADDVSSIKEIIINEVVIPSIRDTLYNGIENALHILLYGQTAPSKKSGGGSVSFISYNNAYRKDTPKTTVSTINTSAKLPDAAMGLTQQEAEDLKAELLGAVEDFGYVSVAEFKQYINSKDIVHTDSKWGWTNLDRMSIRRYRDADDNGNIGYYYMLELPKPGVLENID